MVIHEYFILYMVCMFSSAIPALLPLGLQRKDQYKQETDPLDK